MFRDNQIAAVILDYNKPSLTDRCLESLFSFNIVKTYLVENGDAERNHFAKRYDVKFIKNSKNLGFAAGMNVGIRAAMKDGCTKIILANNDTVFLADCVGLLVKALDSINQIGVAVPNRSASMRFCRKNEAEELRLCVDSDRKMENGSSPSVREVSMVTGFCMAFRADVLSKVGLLDEDFFFIREDDEISLRLRMNGYELIEVLNAYAIHSPNSSIDLCDISALRFISYNSARGSALLCRKYGLSVTKQFTREIKDTARLTLKSLTLCRKLHLSVIFSSIEGFRNGMRAEISNPFS